MGAITEPEPTAPEAPPAPRALRIFLDPLLWLCAFALIAFPVACHLAAARAPVDPRPTPHVWAAKSGPQVRQLPVFAARPRPALDDPAGVRALVEPGIDRVFGARDGVEFRRYLNARLPLPAAPGATPYDYPYRYRGLDALLDGRPPAGELGALLVAAAATRAYPNAGQLAFALLHRARGSCDGQLNLAYLVTASVDPSMAEGELRRAIRACPADPTAAWLLGQWQSLLGDEVSARQTNRALQRRLPGAAAGWAGEADVQLRMAYVDDADGRRFVARSRYRRALALYRRARALDRDPGLLAGEGRALAGLGEHAAAARLAGRAGAATEIRVRVLEDLERAHDFAGAARVAADLAADPQEPRGLALYFTVDGPHSWEQLGALRPLSLGAGQLTGRVFEIRPRLGAVAMAKDNAVENLAFFPVYREDALSVHHPGCAAWSARRDALLAGRPRAALAPAAEPDSCGDEGQLAAVATAELGDERTAAAQLGRVEALGATAAVTQLAEYRQNLWRFAGRYDRAASITTAFVHARPTSIRAYEMAGEVAYLRGRHDEAARDFATAVRLARGKFGNGSAIEATNLLRRGTVLRFAGRYDESVQTLLAADEVATRALADPSPHEPDLDTNWALSVDEAAIEARNQAGDTYLRMGRFADADELYDAARALAAQWENASRPARENNWAVAKLHLAQPAAAVSLARAAVALDPRNPLYLETLSSAYAHAGDHRRAASAAWRAVRGDPTLFNAWTDLGVALARTGRPDGAISAFRRALGVRREYALAWFDLGVVLEASGPREAIAAQGAFARAARYDTKLAGRKHELVRDDRIYFTGLDVSKPLPAKWSFADTQQKWPVPAAGLALALLLGVQLTRAAASGRGLPGGTRRWLETARDLFGRLPRLLVGLGSAVTAILVTVTVLVWPAVHAGDRSFATLAPLIAGLLLVIAMIARVRVLAARQAAVTLRQRSWRPALLVALGGAALGVPLAPLPVAEPARPAPLVHQAGPLVAAAIGLVLAILGAGLHVPATQAIGTAAVVMAASMLIPVAPLDGARLGGGAAAAGFGLVGVAILALVGLG